jgi:threonine/homoserine/homoserine lactone efflux protein
VNGALGRVGRKGNWAAAEKKESRKENVGRVAGWVGFVFSFSNPFQIFFFQTFLIKSFTSFSQPFP